MTPAKETHSLSIESQLDEIKNKMEQLRLTFVEEAILFTKNWMTEKVEELIISIPEFTNKLTPDQLLSLRVESAKVSSGIEASLREYLDDKSLWWHLDPNSGSSKDRYKNLDSFFDEKYRKLIGSVGKVLSKYGYLPKYEINVFGFYCFKDASNSYSYEFINPVFWSNQMKRRMDNYWEQYKYALNLIEGTGEKSQTL